MTEQPSSQKPKEPNAWDKMHPVLRIVIMVVAAFIGEIIMLVLGMMLSANSSSPIALIIFALIIPVSCIFYALYLLLGSKKDKEDLEKTVSALENALEANEHEVQDNNLQDPPAQDLAAEDTDYNLPKDKI
ncbi:MAG: hypothetical protein FWF37_03075 [Chloroflexi bacterium]|nr:hypothetical protein [Chloroflexota bacterium]